MSVSANFASFWHLVLVLCLFVIVVHLHLDVLPLFGIVLSFLFFLWFLILQKKKQHKSRMNVIGDIKKPQADIMGLPKTYVQKTRNCQSDRKQKVNKSTSIRRKKKFILFLVSVFVPVFVYCMYFFCHFAFYCVFLVIFCLVFGHFVPFFCRLCVFFCACFSLVLCIFYCNLVFFGLLHAFCGCCLSPFGCFTSLWEYFVSFCGFYVF